MCAFGSEAVLILAIGVRVRGRGRGRGREGVGEGWLRYKCTKRAFAESAVKSAVISRRSLLYKMIYLLTY